MAYKQNPWTRVRNLLNALIDNSMVFLVTLFVLGMLGFVVVAMVWGIGHSVYTQSWPDDGLALTGVLFAGLFTPALVIILLCVGINRGYRAMERRWDRKHGVASRDDVW